MIFEIFVGIILMIILSLVIVLFFQKAESCPSSEKYIQMPPKIKYVNVCQQSYRAPSRNQAPLWDIQNQSILSTFDRKPLRGISLSGTEIFGMPDMKNFFGDATNQNLLFNHLNTVWKARIIRVPLCMSRYHQNNEYVEFIQQMVDILNKNNMIAILDAHVWDKDWTADNCPSNDKPGITVDGVMNTPGLFDKLKATWTSIASRYKDYSNVFFELFNEPRVEAPYVDPKNIDWKQWQDVHLGFATTVRTVAPNNV